MQPRDYSCVNKPHDWCKVKNLKTKNNDYERITVYLSLIKFKHFEQLSEKEANEIRGFSLRKKLGNLIKRSLLIL